MIFQNFQDKQKGLDITQVLRNMERLEKWKFTCELFGYLHVHGPSFCHYRHEKKKKVQEPQQNGMLSYCIAIGFISKNEEYNPK